MKRTSNMHLLLGLGKADPKPTAPIKVERPKKSKFHFTKTLKAVIGIVLIAVVLASVFAFYQPQPASNTPEDITPISSTNPTDTPSSNSTQTPQNTATPDPNIKPDPSHAPENTSYRIVTNCNGNLTKTEWKKIAEYAWKYYQPGVGVDTNTGLPWTSAGSPYITDWDIGVYIQAVIDSKQLGLISTNGTWEFDNRIDRVLMWLETRELNNASYPYWFYKADDGKVWKENAETTPNDYIDIADTGRLFIALNNLKSYSQFANRVDNLVYNYNHNRSDYAAIVNSVKGESYSSTNIYGYLIIKGFEFFWPTELSGASSRVLDNIFSAGETLTPENVTLPKAKICGDPLLCSLFDINNVDARILTLVNKTYAAHEAYYNSTGKFRAFGEGPQISTDWQWEWVVLPDGRTWIPLNGNGNSTGVPPVIYTKIAVGFLAVYNTVFTVRMVSMIEKSFSEPVTGYYEGVDEQDSTLATSGSLTNGLILGAALYYINHHQS